jgi:hypothetical protein
VRLPVDLGRRGTAICIGIRWLLDAEAAWGEITETDEGGVPIRRTYFTTVRQDEGD